MVVFSLTLVRHGETTANKDGIIQGHQDVALSNVGLEQARLVAVRLQNDNFTHIFASDLSRASQTAQAIAEANTVCHCSIQLDKRLRERRFGVFEGKTFKELNAAAQNHNKKWADFTPDGAETYSEVRFRAQAFFRELCETMVMVGSPIDGMHISSAFRDRSSGGITGLSNDTVFVAADGKTGEKLLPSRQNCLDGGANTTTMTTATMTSNGSDANTGARVVCMSSYQTGPLQLVEDGVASKRARIEDTELQRLSLDGVGPSEGDRDRQCALGETPGAGATTTMARSNSSSSSGCSSLHDSVECPEADLDLATPIDEEKDLCAVREVGIQEPGCCNSKTGSVSIPGRTHQPPRTFNYGSGGGGVGCDSSSPAGTKWEGLQPWFRDVDPSPLPSFLESSSAGVGVVGSNGVSLQTCPNVSLSPLAEHRLTSMSSVSSGRNSSFDDADIVPLLAGEVLVVSHGGLIKELVAHFIEDFGCKVPGGKGHALRVCPNTGVSRFMVTLGEPSATDADLRPTVTCLLIHDKDHLSSLAETPSLLPAV